MRFDLIVRGRLVLPHATVPDGWIGVVGERIAAIGVGPAPEAARLHDAGSAFVMPGFVDGQTHATSYAGLPGFRSTTRSAVAGGITTLVDMPYDNPEPLNTLERLAAKAEAVARESVADVALYGTVAPDQGVETMAALAEAGVAAFKLSSFESHPVRFPRIPNDRIFEILRAAAPLGLPVGLHNEDQEIVRATVASLRARNLQTPEWHAPSRPVAAELASTASFLALGLAAGAHAHIVHISCPEGFALVRKFQEMGAQCTAEMCAHYLHFDAARDMARLGARMKVNPPIRENSLDGLWQALRDGLVDFVSSDHSSWPVDNKLTPSIFDAGAGIPGLETLVPSFFTDLAAHGADPERALVRLVAENPARFFGLARKGQLSVGADADIVVLQPGPHVFRAAETHDELNWSPYDGEQFDARVTATFVRGTLVWDGKTVVGQPGHGRFVRRERR
jgi:allantoinase